jgi:predicted metal-dependent HD superfamily phosphohydrolase
VVKNVMEIGSAEKIDNNSLELLVIAAYFHDVGHVSGSRNHEKMSCRYAMDFLKENGCQQDQLEIVQGIILATAMPQNPHTELQKIICDADLSHIGKASFWSQNEGLRLEWSVYDHNVFSDKQWVELNIKFFECHEFKTLYARDKFGKRKNRNLAQLKNQLKDLISID